MINTIKDDMKEAMRNKEAEKLSTLRMLLAELEKEKVSLKLSDVSQLTKDQVLAVVNRQLKKLDKEIESYIAVNREVSKQQAEQEVLRSYLPQQLKEDEIREVILHTLDLVKRGEIDVPMKYLSQRLKGKADMKLVQQLVKELS